MRLKVILRLCLTNSLAILAAVGCGGGGGGTSSVAASPAAVTPPVAPPVASPPVITPPASTIPAASQFKGQLANTGPGAGASASDWLPATCTDQRQKNWVRSWLNDEYLFYRDAPLLTIDPNTYSGSVENLFHDYTTRGVPAKDKFSFVMTQAAANATFQSGTVSSVGFVLRRDSSNGNVLRIAYVHPNGPAAAVGFVRGMTLASVDGVSTLANLPAAQSDKLFASSVGTTAEVGVQDVIGGPIRTISVSTAVFAVSPVIVDRILPGSNVAYLAYNSFSTPIGEVQLADAFKRFSVAGATDLVVDLRYNGGGFLDISAQLGFLVGGAIKTSGKSFETLVYNDKRSAENITIPFRSAITSFFGNGARAGEALVPLNLQRVFVVTTGSTCSASESFIAGLQGVDVEVVRIGGATCGKPYGFTQDNNCTLSFFGIEFEGRNHKGNVTPVTGIAPNCSISDDFDRQLGDPEERMLAGALYWQRTGTCPPGTAVVAAQPPASSSQIQLGDTVISRPSGAMEFVTNPLETIKLIQPRP
jgi:carboxyl-terminal processing protease